MKKSIARVTIVATVVVGLVAGFATPASATTGTKATQANGSYGPVHLFLTGSYATPSTSFAWTDNVIAAASTSDITSVIACPVGSTSAATFLAARGSENTKSSWSAYAASSFVSGTQNVSQANLKPAGLTSGTPGANTVKTQGGSYSLGIACLSNSGATVDRTYYRYVTITASTGAWTAAATDPTPSITVTQSVDNAAHSPAFAQPHTSDVLNAQINSVTGGSASDIPEGFAVGFQWYANGSAISSATGSTYTTVANDAGKVITVKATYTRSGYTDVVQTSAATAAIEGDAVVSGDVTVNATVLDAVNGQLSLSVATNATANLSSASLVANFSTSTGSLPNLTVTDGRVVSQDGWDLKATATSFAKSTDSSITIPAAQLGIAPAISGSTTGVTAGTASTAGSTTYPYTLASQSAGHTLGDPTVVNGTLTFVAPQNKPGGTYTSTLTVTVYSK
jgi:hypothetical protein